MNTSAKSSSADDFAASPPSLSATTSSPPASSSNQLSPSEHRGLPGGGSVAAVPASRRKSSSSASSAHRSRNFLAGSSPAYSKSTPTDASQPEPPAAPRIVYGPGKIFRLPTELGRLRVSAPLIVSSPSRISLARHIQSLIPNLNSRILDSAVVSVPAHVVDDAVSRIDDRDVVISIGGASAVGLAKAIGCRKSIPHVCIPTTYSGSEMMPLLLDACPARHGAMSQTAPVAGSDPQKPRRRRRERVSSSHSSSSSSSSSRTGRRTTSFRDPRVMPEVVIYDVDLATSLPKRLSAPSDETAMARSVKIRQGDETSQWSYLHLPGV